MFKSHLQIRSHIQTKLRTSKQKASKHKHTQMQARTQ